MGVTVTQHKNFVGGEWVDAVEGGTMEVLNPATGETIAEVPQRDAGRRRPRRRGGQRGAARSGSRRRRASAPRLLLKLADVDRRRTPRSSPSSSRRTSASRSAYARDEMPVSRGQPPLLRRRGARARGQVGRRVHARLHLDDPARAARDRRRDRAVELPADDGGLEARPGARRRQRPGPEAVRADAALDCSASPSSPQDDPPAGRAERRSPATASRSARRIVRHPDVAPGLAHRRRRDRQGDRAHGRGHAQARPPRARRQGAGARLRRRRPGRGRRGDQDRRLLELGPGLHRRLARGRRAEDLRQAARGARAAGRVAARRRPGRGRRDRDGPGDLEGAAGARARLPRPRRRARRCSPAAARTATAASSSSRPWSPTSARTTRSSSARCSGRS